MDNTEGMEQALQLERDRLVSILNLMIDGVSIMNKDFDVEYVNPSMQSQFGVIRGRKCYQYFNGRDDPCPWCNNEEVLSGKISTRDAHLSKTGRVYEIIDMPLKNTDGSISKLAVFHDIT